MMQPNDYRVLVVEDDAAIQLLITDTLADEGYEVRVASNGIAALETLDRWLPDVILLDLTLPEMDGPTFRTQQLGLPPPASEVPVILVTGVHEQRAVVDQLRAAGLVRKPFDLDAVVALVGEVVDSHRGNLKEAN